MSGSFCNTTILFIFDIKFLMNTNMYVQASCLFCRITDCGGWLGFDLQKIMLRACLASTKHLHERATIGVHKRDCDQRIQHRKPIRKTIRVGVDLDARVHIHNQFWQIDTSHLQKCDEQGKKRLRDQSSTDLRIQLFRRDAKIVVFDEEIHSNGHARFDDGA